jgi:hypothetical protein
MNLGYEDTDAFKLIRQILKDEALEIWTKGLLIGKQERTRT